MRFCYTPQSSWSETCVTHKRPHLNLHYFTLALPGSYSQIPRGSYLVFLSLQTHDSNPNGRNKPQQKPWLARSKTSTVREPTSRPLLSLPLAVLPPFIPGSQLPLIQTEVTPTARDTFWHLLVVAVFHDKHSMPDCLQPHLTRTVQQSSLIPQSAYRPGKPAKSYFWPHTR